MFGRCIQDELGIAGAAFDFLVEVSSLFFEMTGLGFQAHFKIGTVLFGLASGGNGMGVFTKAATKPWW